TLHETAVVLDEYVVDQRRMVHKEPANRCEAWRHDVAVVASEHGQKTELIAVERRHVAEQEIRTWCPRIRCHLYIWRVHLWSTAASRGSVFSRTDMPCSAKRNALQAEGASMTASTSRWLAASSRRSSQWLSTRMCIASG